MSAAEDLLKEIHEIGIPSLYAPGLASTEREASVKLAKQKLKLVKKQLREEMDTIKKQWDGRNAYEAEQERLHLASYKALDTLTAKLEVAIAELEIRGAEAKPVTFGTQLVGSFETGEWHVFTEKEAIAWYANLYKTRIADVESLIEFAQAKRRSIRGLIFAILIMGAGVYAVHLALQVYGVLTDSAGIMAAGLGGFIILVGLVLFGRWISGKSQLKRQIEEYQQLVQKHKQTLRELKQAYDQLKQTVS